MTSRGYLVSIGRRRSVSVGVLPKTYDCSERIDTGLEGTYSINCIVFVDMVGIVVDA